MIFSNVVMYFIILSTAATLHKAGITDVESAAEVAQALQPLAGDLAGMLFLLGVIGVGFLAVPVMTTGAAYDVAQGLLISLGASPPPQSSQQVRVWLRAGSSSPKFLLP
jgi:Mn2+/Fe2+ NRAMP family transporter